jgi:hypothetical protein
MGRCMARAILAAAAAGTTVAVVGLTAAGPAGAATRPARVAYHPDATAGAATGRAPAAVTHDLAGYATAALENWKFRSVAATVPVPACQVPVAASSNPIAAMQLVGTTKWDADISVLCNGGPGSIGFFDQKTATTAVQRFFRLTPRVGDRLRISISRNVAGHQDSFTVTNLRTRRSQTVRVTTSTAVVYHHAFLGAGVASNPATLPATSELLWTFQSSRVVTYGGVGRTVRGPWSVVRVIDRSGGHLVMFPGALSSGGADFSINLNHA